MNISADIPADAHRPLTPGNAGCDGTPCRAAGLGRWQFFTGLLCFVLLTRFVSEAVNTFLWDGANYAWSACALAGLVLVLWPLLLTLARGEGNVFRDYFPVFLYLLVLLARVQFGEVYSLKCFLSEVIVWSCFLLTVEACSRSQQAASAVRKWLVRIVQVTVVLGVCQLVIFLVSAENLGLRALLEARPVRGVFVHPNLFPVVVLPFFFYFLKQRSWTWCLLTALACLGTGTRSPLLATACLAILIWRSAARRPITWLHLGVTLAIVVAAYYVLISWNAGEWDYRADSRTNLSSLQWRIAHWQHFLEDRRPAAVWLGHGVGSADGADTENGEPDLLPHNDYLRIYYDLGLVGLAATGLLILFLVRLLMRSATVHNDFMLLAFLLIVCFRFTDNFMYVTVPLWIYMFIGSSGGVRREGSP